MLNMNKFLSDNIVSLAIALVTLASMWGIYGYRIDSLEKRQDRQSEAIIVLQANNTKIEISLARIETDINYIKVQLMRIIEE